LPVPKRDPAYLLDFMKYVQRIPLERGRFHIRYGALRCLVHTYGYHTTCDKSFHGVSGTSGCFGCECRAKGTGRPSHTMKRLVTSCVVTVYVHQASGSPVPDAQTSTLQRKCLNTNHTGIGELASVMCQSSHTISLLINVIMHQLIEQQASIDL
jgi:hypothetical protein